MVAAHLGIERGACTCPRSESLRSRSSAGGNFFGNFLSDCSGRFISQLSFPRAGPSLRLTSFEHPLGICFADVQLTIARALLSAGAAVNHTEETGAAALHYAARSVCGVCACEHADWPDHGVRDTVPIWICSP